MKDHDLAKLKYDMINPFTKLVPEGAKNGFGSVSAIKLICDQAGPEVEWTKCSESRTLKARWFHSIAPSSPMCQHLSDYNEQIFGVSGYLYDPKLAGKQ